MMSDKPANYICPQCGLESEPIKHPFREGWREWSSCPVCSELKRKRETEETILLQIDAMIEDIGGILFARGISGRFTDASLDQFPGSMKKLHEGPKGIFLSGPCGTGKTHFMAAVMRKLTLDLLAEGKERLKVPYSNVFPLFVSVPDFLSMVRASFTDRTKENEAALIDRFSNCSTLFLDDIGAEKVTDWSLSIIFLIVDRRYRDMRKTFFSSNLTIGELSRALDDRIASRISEMCRPINLTGADRRLKG